MGETGGKEKDEWFFLMWLEQGEIKVERGLYANGSRVHFSTAHSHQHSGHSLRTRAWMSRWVRRGLS